MTEHIRRFQLPITIVAVACVLNLTIGCASSGDWGKEWVELPAPSRAMVEADGTVHLGFYVERELQPEYTGWHWRMLSEERSSAAVLPLPEDQRWTNSYSVRAQRVHGPDNELSPGLLEPGLRASASPPRAEGPLTEWAVVRDRHTGMAMLVPPGVGGAADQPRTPTLSFGPPSPLLYQADADRRTEDIAKTLASPIQVVVIYATLPVWFFKFAGMLDPNG